MSVLDANDPDKAPLSVIFGLSGFVLTAQERAFFKAANPFGFILFARNCGDPGQVKALIQSLHDCLGRAVPVLIDQEGGRVQRLKPPHWKTYPPAREFGELFLRDFAKGREALVAHSAALAAELRENAFNVNCAPVLDVLFPQTHQAIGDRAFSSDPDVVAALGAVVCETFLREKIIPVIKHMPGHGRAICDSHHDLPMVDTPLAELRATDFMPFREILHKAFSGAIWGMVAHVIYKSVDGRLPSSCSRRVIYDVIRQDIGFKGFLLSDDLCMGALSVIGGAGARAEQVLRAGCDIALHCNGNLEEMKDVAHRAGKMAKESITRYNRSIQWMEQALS